MITDDQGTQILKKMDEQFTKVNEKMDEGFKKVDKRFKKIERVLGNVTFMLVNHDHLLKSMPTRKEFDTFKSENLTAHDRTVKAIEAFDQELTSSTEAHDRLEEQVDTHEKALIAHKILTAPAL